MKIILTLEQFPVFWPGAYGNKTQSMPGLDAFTLESTVFDRAYSSRADGLETLFQLWESCDFSAERFAGKKVFLSDLPVDAPDFFDAGKTVDSGTFFSQEISEMLDPAEMAESEISDPKSVGLVWIHFQDWRLEELDAWLMNEANRTCVLAILGTSGELPEGDVRLYSSEVQLPWWIRFPEPSFAGTRSRELVTDRDFQKILDAGSPDAKYRENLLILAENARWALVTEEWFLTGFEPEKAAESRDCGFENGSFEDRSSRDADRIDSELREVGEENAPELYFKPSDWWDQNDVASRCFDEVQELLRLRDSLS